MAPDPAPLNGPLRGFNRWPFGPWSMLVLPLVLVLAAISYAVSSVLRTRFDEAVIRVMVVVLFAEFVVGAASRIEKALRRERSH